jgi:hypothetical protein
MPSDADGKVDLLPRTVSARPASVKFGAAALGFALLAQAHSLSELGSVSWLDASFAGRLDPGSSAAAQAIGDESFWLEHASAPVTRARLRSEARDAHGFVIGERFMLTAPAVDAAGVARQFEIFAIEPWSGTPRPTLVVSARELAGASSGRVLRFLVDAPATGTAVDKSL